MPAPHVPGVLGDALTPEIAAALGDVTFGPMAVLSIRTDETAPMPWDDLYSVLTPDLRFNMFFNHANFMHGTAAEAGQRDHGLRRRPARPRAARRSPRTPCATPSSPTST